MTETTRDPAEYELIQVDRTNGIAVVTLNRPEARNALSQQMVAEVMRAIQELSEDPAVHVVVLTGTGRAFCAGLDLRELQSAGAAVQPDEMGPQGRVMKAFRDCPKPIIGAINGYAITGGFELALACDFLYAAESAQFADTHARVGIVPGWGLSQKLPRLVGINRAREISFTGNFFSATDALAWGLVNRVVPDDRLMEETLKCAEQIAETQPAALLSIRRTMNDGWELSLGEALELEGLQAGRFNASTSLQEMEERLHQLRARSRQ